MEVADGVEASWRSPCRCAKDSRLIAPGSDTMVVNVGCFFFQAEDGIRDIGVTGVQTCALPIYEWHAERRPIRRLYQGILQIGVGFHHARGGNHKGALLLLTDGIEKASGFVPSCQEIGRASCRERV